MSLGGLSIFKTIFIYVVGFIFINIAFIGAGIFSVYRFFIGLYLSHKYKCRIKFVEGADAIFCLDDEKTPFFNQIGFVFKGVADLEKIRERVHKCLLEPRNEDGRWKHIKLRQELKFDLSYYFWIMKSDFRLQDHVIEYDGSHVKTKDEYQQLLEKLGTTLTSEKRIFWQFTVIHMPNGIPGTSSEPHFILYFNVHHGYLDAISGIRIFMQFLDDTSFDSKMFKKRIEITSFFDRCLHWAQIIVLGFFRFCQHLAVKPKLVSFGTKMTGKRVVSLSPPISFDKVKKIKSVTGTTCNDVLVSCVIGAFKMHLLSQNRSIKETIKCNIPISLHDVKNEAKCENKMSFLSLFIDLDVSSPIDCLKKTKIAMDKLKHSPEMFIVHYMAKCCINTIPRWLIMPFVKRFQTNAVLSNVPTPFSGSFLGNEFKHAVPLGTPNTLSGCGIIIGMLTDKETVTIAIKADTGVMENQEVLNRFIQFFLKQLEDLYEATVVE